MLLLDPCVEVALQSRVWQTSVRPKIVEDGRSVLVLKMDNEGEASEVHERRQDASGVGLRLEGVVVLLDVSTALLVSMFIPAAFPFRKSIANLLLEKVRHICQVWEKDE